MTVFRKSVSWSKFLLALTCPLKLQNTLDKAWAPSSGWSRPAAMGKLVQKVFELYFNKDLNLDSRGRDPKILVRILDKVLASKWAEDERIDDTFREEAIPQLETGYTQFVQQKMLGFRIRSEVPVKGIYDGFRLFGQIDFLAETQIGCFLFDGKGNAEKNADARQLKYYGLTLHATGRKLVGGGFMYWKHDYESVPLDAKSLYDFAHSDDFVKARKIFNDLQDGVSVLPADPSPTKCHRCLWGKTCTFSASKKPPGEVFEGIQEVSF